jgi:hypothetical protein
MSPVTKYAIGAGAAVLFSWIFLPGWFTLLVVLGVVGVPAIAYMMLDPTQRQRLRRANKRGIGR